MKYIITKKSILYLMLVLFLVFPATLSWSAGKLEEKYYLLLDSRTNFFSRKLELSFFEYARENELNLVVVSVDTFDPEDKFSINRRGADYLYPVIIMSGYEPGRLQEIEDFYFKKGESSLEGNMGSALFINDPFGYKKDFAFRLPWYSIAFDSTQMAKEILISQGQTVTDEQIQKLDAMSINTVKNFEKDTNSATRTLLVIITGYSHKEHNLYSSIYHKLEFLNTDTSLEILPLYAVAALDPNYDPEEAAKRRKEIEIAKKKKEQEDLAKGIEPPTKESLIASFSVKDTLTYQFFNEYIKNHSIPSNTSTIVAPSDATGLIVRQFFIDKQITKSPPQIIGFGNSPEGTPKGTNEDSPIILTFDLDYKKYVKLIMEKSKKLYEEVKRYPHTDRMMEGKDPYRTFTSEEEIFPLKAIHH